MAKKILAAAEELYTFTMCVLWILFGFKSKYALVVQDPSIIECLGQCGPRRNADVELLTLSVANVEEIFSSSPQQAETETENLQQTPSRTDQRVGDNIPDSLAYDRELGELLAEAFGVEYIQHPPSEDGCLCHQPPCFVPKKVVATERSSSPRTQQLREESPSSSECRSAWMAQWRIIWGPSDIRSMTEMSHDLIKLCEEQSRRNRRAQLRLDRQAKKRFPLKGAPRSARRARKRILSRTSSVNRELVHSHRER